MILLFASVFCDLRMCAPLLTFLENHYFFVLNPLFSVLSEPHSPSRYGQGFDKTKTIIF